MQMLHGGAELPDLSYVHLDQEAVADDSTWIPRKPQLK